MKAQAPPDTRPGALVLAGMRRGFLLVFLPIVLAGQAIAWLAYVIGGAFGPWSWVKIGLAYSLMSARVPFDVTAHGFATLEAEGRPGTGTLELALGALTVAALVLAFRAGRAQARGLERAPAQAAVAGASVGMGFAVPMLIIAVPVRLAFPSLDVTAVEPVLPLALLLPLVLGAAAGVAGGLATARPTLEDGRGEPLTRAARAAGLMAWWGLVLATIGTLVFSAVDLGATRAYARTVGGAGEAGAVAIVHHALLIPNQSAMVLAASMGAPVEVNDDQIGVLRVSMRSLDGDALEDPIALSPAFWLFLLVPAAATVHGGRTAGEGARSRRDAALIGALAGVGYGVLCGSLAWFASIQLPFLALGGSLTVGPYPPRTAVVGMAWGVVGGTLGALLGRGRPRAT